MAALAAAGSSEGGSSTSETEARDLQQARSASLVHTDDRWVRAVLEGLQPEGTWKRSPLATMCSQRWSPSALRMILVKLVQGCYSC